MADNERVRHLEIDRFCSHHDNQINGIFIFADEDDQYDDQADDHHHHHHHRRKLLNKDSFF